MVLDKPLDNVNPDISFGPGLSSTVGDGSFRSGLKPWQKLKPSIEILCNNQVLSLILVYAMIWYLLVLYSAALFTYFLFSLVTLQVLSPDMSLATVRNYIWKKPEDLVLNYRMLQGR